MVNLRRFWDGLFAPRGIVSTLVLGLLLLGTVRNAQAGLAPTPTPTPRIECCQFLHSVIPNQPVCFDTNKCAQKCELLGGTCIQGFCDPVDERCKTTPPTQQAPFCCQCPVSSPPFPDPSICFDTFRTDKCTTLVGCVLIPGAACDPVTEACVPRVPTPTPTRTRPPTRTPTQTGTPTNTKPPTRTPTRSPTRTPTNTKPPTLTPTRPPTRTPTNTKPPTLPPTRTPTNTRPPTRTPTNTRPTRTPTNTRPPTRTPTRTRTSTPTNTPTITPRPQTECCQFPHPVIPGQPVCFDTDKCAAKCPLLGGVCVQGFCDPVDELCKPSPPTQEAPLCCECPVSSPPFPDPSFCFDTFRTDKCISMGPGCVLVPGQVCDAVTEVCRPRTCGNGTVDPGEDCDPPGSLCPDGLPCSPKCTCTHELDPFPNSQGMVTIITPMGPEMVVLTGPTTVDVSLGLIADTDGDGLEQVPTEIVQLSLTGLSSVGPVMVMLRDPSKHPFMRTMGEIEENVNNTPGVLDLPPLAPTGTANSFFDVFVQLDIPGLGLRLHNNTPKHLTAMITHKPPATDEAYEDPQTIPLFDEDENPVPNVSLGPAKHIPNPRCGNGIVDPGEQCDPPGSVCPNGQVCSTVCTCPPVPTPTPTPPPGNAFCCMYTCTRPGAVVAVRTCSANPCPMTITVGPCMCTLAGANPVPACTECPEDVSACPT